MKEIFIPYIIFSVAIILELGAIIYLMMKNQNTKVPTSKQKERKPETFNGFYVDR